MGRRTILYYPTITIPNGVWLRQALLYFDDVGSIYPSQLGRDWEDEGARKALPEHMKLLEGEKQYRRFPPETLNRTATNRESWALSREFVRDFRELVRSRAFGKNVPDPPARDYVEVHDGKLAGLALGALHAKGLVKPGHRDRAGNRWHAVESTAADLYLGLLAIALAQHENDRSFARSLTTGVEPVTVVTGTDTLDNEDLAWRTRGKVDGDRMIEARWLGLLPSPGPDVPLKKIIKFKRKHREQLLALRAEMDALGDEIGKGDPSRAAVRWSEKVGRGLSRLDKAMKQSLDQVIWGSFKSMLDVKMTGAVTAMTALGVLAVITVPLAVAGVAAAGTIQIADQVTDHGRRKREAIAGQPISFLFTAERKGIIPRQKRA